MLKPHRHMENLPIHLNTYQLNTRSRPKLFEMHLPLSPRQRGEVFQVSAAIAHWWVEPLADLVVINHHVPTYLCEAIIPEPIAQRVSCKGKTC